MSSSSRQEAQAAINGTVLVIALAAVFCFTASAVVVIAVAVPDGGNAGSLIALLVATLAPTLATIANLVKTTGVEQRLEDVAANAEQLTNGGMDAKIRAGVADVLRPSMVDPEVEAQLVHDRDRGRLEG